MSASYCGHKDCKASTSANCLHPDPRPPQPFTCPVCTGRGKVASGFYDRTELTWNGTCASAIEECRSCEGTGVLWR